MLCKCRTRTEYWNAIGSKANGYFTRKTILKAIFLGAIPVAGQVLLIFAILSGLARASEPDRVPEKYRLKYIEKLVRVKK
jgi:hypothetical protein